MFQQDTLLLNGPAPRRSAPLPDNFDDWFSSGAAESAVLSRPFGERMVGHDGDLSADSDRWRNRWHGRCGSQDSPTSCSMSHQRRWAIGKLRDWACGFDSRSGTRIEGLGDDNVASSFCRDSTPFAQRGDSYLRPSVSSIKIGRKCDCTKNSHWCWLERPAWCRKTRRPRNRSTQIGTGSVQ